MLPSHKHRWSFGAGRTLSVVENIEGGPKCQPYPRDGPILALTWSTFKGHVYNKYVNNGPENVTHQSPP